MLTEPLKLVDNSRQDSEDNLSSYLCLWIWWTVVPKGKLLEEDKFWKRVQSTWGQQVIFFAKEMNKKAQF